MRFASHVKLVEFETKKKTLRWGSCNLPTIGFALSFLLLWCHAEYGPPSSCLTNKNFSLAISNNDRSEMNDTMEERQDRDRDRQLSSNDLSKVLVKLRDRAGAGPCICLQTRDMFQ